MAETTVSTYHRPTNRSMHNTSNLQSNIVTHFIRFKDKYDHPLLSHISDTRRHDKEHKKAVTYDVTHIVTYDRCQATVSWHKTRGDVPPS